MKNFRINYPRTEETILGTIKTTRSEWSNLDFSTKVLLLGSFVKELVPEYEYPAIDFVPTKKEPWEHDVKGQHIGIFCETSALSDTDAALIFTLMRISFIPAELVEAE
jgi:hypothetical protein